MKGTTTSIAVACVPQQYKQIAIVVILLHREMRNGGAPRAGEAEFYRGPSPGTGRPCSPPMDRPLLWKHPIRICLLREVAYPILSPQLPLPLTGEPRGRGREDGGRSRPRTMPECAGAAIPQTRSPVRASRATRRGRLVRTML